MGIRPIVLPADIPEDLDFRDIDGSLRNIAEQKAHTALAKYEDEGKTHVELWIIGADTIIWYDGRVIGKLPNESQARETLDLLSGNTHSVLTGICVQKAELVDGRYVASGPGVTEVADTKVTFKQLTDDDVSWYLATGEWREAAGAYRIQGRGACLIDYIEGSYTNVVGLPLERIYGILGTLGYQLETGQ